MRVPIVYEDKTAPNGIYICANSLWWTDEPILLTSTKRGLLGCATDLRREPDGSITAELKDRDGNEYEFDKELYSAAITSTNNEFEVDEHAFGKMLTKGRIREVMIVPTAFGYRNV